MINVLFVCTANLMRSPTAQLLFSGYPGVRTSSAGVRIPSWFPENADYRGVPLTEDLVEWAHLIVCMEEEHKTQVVQQFGDSRNIAVLGIRDYYNYFDYELVKALMLRVPPLLDYEKERRGV